MNKHVIIIWILVVITLYFGIDNLFLNLEIKRVRPPYNEMEARYEKLDRSQEKLVNTYREVNYYWKTQADTLQFEKQALIRRLNAQIEINKTMRYP